MCTSLQNFFEDVTETTKADDSNNTQSNQSGMGTNSSVKPFATFLDDDGLLSIPSRDSSAHTHGHSSNPMAGRGGAVEAPLSPTPSFQYPPSPMSHSWNSLYYDSESTVRLQREASPYTMFLDYDRLKGQIKKIVHLLERKKHAKKVEQQMASNPESKNPPEKLVQSSSSYDSALKKAHMVFWCVLEAEVDKINNFFVKQEEGCLQKLNVLQLDCKGAFQQGVDPMSSATFIKALNERNPKLAQSILHRKHLEQADSVGIEESLYEKFQQFVSLCEELDKLRKYVILNYIAVLKIIKKYDLYTDRNAKDHYLLQLSEEPLFASHTLSICLTRAEGITNKLVKRKDVKEVQNRPFSLCAPTRIQHSARSKLTCTPVNKEVEGHAWTFSGCLLLTSSLKLITQFFLTHP